MTTRRSVRVARALVDHPPQLEPAARAAIEDRLVEAARLRAIPPARSYEELAEVLRVTQPSLGSVARRRVEERMLEAWRRRRTASKVAGGAALALVAAAAAIAFGLSREGQGVAGRAVDGASALRFARRVGAEVVETGAVERPGSLTTGPEEQLELRRGDSRFTLDHASRAAVREITSTVLAFGLSVGHLEVAFHPAVRGRESLTIDTPQARVEVVGTVFAVEAGGDGTTTVRVDEGVVRVIERASGADRRVRAGERLVVGAPAASPGARSGVSAVGGVPEGLVTAPAEETRPSAREVPSTGGAEVEGPSRPGHRHGAVARAELHRGPPSPTARFAEAERLFDRGRYADARAALRPLLSGSPSVQARALTITAESYVREGSLRAAAQAYAAASQRGAGTMDGANASYALGRLAERQLGDPQLARTAYDAYLEAQPRGALAHQAHLALCRLGDRAHCL